MKKFFALLLVLTCVFTFAACGGDTGDTGSDTPGPVDMSAFPADINEWTGQNYIDYFKAQGLFIEEGSYKTWLQDHAEYFPGTPVSENAGWWDANDETGEHGYMMILIASPDLADSSQEAYDEWMNYIRENHKLNEEFTALKVDHLVGNAAFCYSELTLNDDELAKIEAAYEQFIADTGATAEF